MKPLNYLNYDLLLEGQAGAYQGRIIQSPVGEVPPTPLPRLTVDREMNEVLDRVRGMILMNPSGTVSKTETDAGLSAKQLGNRLFASVFTGDLYASLLRSMDEADRQECGLRIRLHLNATELTDVPWEYLYYTLRNHFFAASLRTPIVRYIELAQRTSPIRINPPLKVLVTIAQPGSASPYPPLNVEREWSLIQQSLGALLQAGTVVLERLDAPTLRTLRAKLEQDNFHIWHFIGHGGFDPARQQGILLLQDAGGQDRLANGDDLARCIGDARSLWLVVLNACETAQADPQHAFSGVAQGLVQQGLAAVIAMRLPIRDPAAIAFSNGLYQGLADGLGIDAALTETRKDMADQGYEWGIPALFMRANDGRLFDVAGTAPRPATVTPPRPADATALPPPDPAARQRAFSLALTYWFRTHLYHAGLEGIKDEKTSLMQQLTPVAISLFTMLASRGQMVGGMSIVEGDTQAADIRRALEPLRAATDLVSYVFTSGAPHLLPVIYADDLTLDGTMDRLEQLLALAAPFAWLGTRTDAETDGVYLNPLLVYFDPQKYQQAVRFIIPNGHRVQKQISFGDALKVHVIRGLTFLTKSSTIPGPVRMLAGAVNVPDQTVAWPERKLLDLDSWKHPFEDKDLREVLAFMVQDPPAADSKPPSPP